MSYSWTRRFKLYAAVQPAPGELYVHEIDAQAIEALPDAAAMSLINTNVATPINAAGALNAPSDGAVAVANAEQTAPITQTI